MSRHSMEKVLFHGTEKIQRGTLPGFRKTMQSKLFVQKRRGVSYFSAVIFEVKNLGKGWESNPYLPLQKPVVLPTAPWEPLEFLTNVSGIIKIFGATETRTQTYRFKTILS